MARIRTVKPEFWTDEKVVECSIAARLLFIGLFNFANDRGCLERSPKRIKMQVFPADLIDCEPLIAELITHELLTEYSVNGVNYLRIPGFLKHQKINRPSKSSIPMPSGFTESGPNDSKDSVNDVDNPPLDSLLTQGALSESSVSSEGVLTDGREKEGKGKDKNIESIPCACDEDFLEDPQPQGNFSLIGKIPVTGSWLPSSDFSRRAALWGCYLGNEPGYTPEELQQFRDYWEPEGKVRHHQQWEQAFAQSLRQQRAKTHTDKRRSSSSATQFSAPNDTIPPGFN
ncbi:hypothetical protein CWC46_07750 [Prodigiosinella confusarubida]|uniref:DnaT DNA-binding domain-containing protein n=1 Tax=Serratia sp. (strain ATCC 39006) TaxID=104623 RepID=A0A2I5THJ5_SERS3|nr:DnaT-like ssDNA-binding domain-containing protein [Serratia sp. ATCC 39006]AUG99724.1 hypothetical protein CWC46_07750 [Serratia sp. ATCC 39006]AUH04043.1 hypothetical protein Ser39006_007755 [Serratia sp. ATCC 39006]